MIPVLPNLLTMRGALLIMRALTVEVYRGRLTIAAEPKSDRRVDPQHRRLGVSLSSRESGAVGATGKIWRKKVSRCPVKTGA